MTGVTDLAAHDILDTLIGSYPYVGLFTVVGSDSGIGFTEVSGGSYARYASGSGDWSVSVGSAPSYVTNITQFNFPDPTGSWGTVVGFGLFDASTSGNLGAWDFLGAGLWLPTTVSNASPGVLTAKAHGFSAADIVEFTNEYGGTSPTFSQSNFTGQLAVVSPATDTFTVTNSATAVNTSSTGSGMVRKLVSQTIGSGGLVYFPIGALIIRVA